MIRHLFAFLCLFCCGSLMILSAQTPEPSVPQATPSSNPTPVVSSQPATGGLNQTPPSILPETTPTPDATPSASPLNYTISELTFIPPTYTVGDPVELHITLLPKEGTRIIKSSEIPSQTWINIRSVEVKSDPPYTQVIVKFVPFAPGARTLPSLVLGDVVLDNIHLHTGSVVDVANPGQPAGPRDPFPLPQTELFLALIIILILLIPFLIWKVKIPVFFILKRWKEFRTKRKPFRKLNRGLRKLSQKNSTLKGPEFYTLFSLLIRQYLTDKLGTSFQSVTPPELTELLSFMPVAWRVEWVRLLHQADIVRFDARNPGEKEKMEDIKSLKNLALWLEMKPKERSHGNL